MKEAPGRPRDSKRHEAILEATRQLILDSGYSRVTFDAVAKRAGASRMTVHRWWRHRTELVLEALMLDDEDAATPDTGLFEEDLTVLVTEAVDRLTDPVAVASLPPLRAELVANPDLLDSTFERYGKRYASPFWDRWNEVFTRAAKRGELSTKVDGVAAMLVVQGAIETFSSTRPSIMSRKRMAPYLVSLLLHGIIDLEGAHTG